MDWAATKYPSQIITYEEVAQAVFSLGRVQSKQSAPVKSIRGQMSSSGKLLMSHYKRTIISMPGVGVRASIDDADILQGTLTKDVQRHKQTATKLQKTAALINPTALAAQLETLDGDPEMKEQLVELATWFSDDLSKYLKTLKRPKVAAALLPPPPAE